MKYFTIATLLFTSLTSAYASSLCKIRAKVKIERSENRAYLWCLGDFSEDGDGYFYSGRTLRYRNISKEECEMVAEDLVGQDMNLQFLQAPPLGMVIIANNSQTYECRGTVMSISKIKYKERSKAD